MATQGELQIVENRPLTKVEVVAQKRLIQEVMEAVMKEGTHYGTIPGCKQPSLYKAGSEAILSTFRIAVEPSVEDLSHHDCYRYRVTLRGVLPSGEIVGAGVGECSTDEEKYKWRGAVCIEEFNTTPEDRRRVVWKKADKFHRENYSINQVRTNPADLANTVLKMAKKRAQIDLTLTATGASDVFAQDLEDLPDEIRESLTEEQPQRSGKPAVNQPQAKSQQQKPATESANGESKSAAAGAITESQAKLIYARLKSAEITPEAFCAAYNISKIQDLQAAEINSALEQIKNGTIASPAPSPASDSVCTHCQQDIDKDGHAYSCPLWEPN